MNNEFRTTLSQVLLFTFACAYMVHLGVAMPGVVQAQQRTINLNANDLIPKAEIFFSPQSGTFTEGSTFELPVFINTKGANVNTIELHIKYDPSKLTIIQPSAGKSVIGLWLEAPSYDNTKGLVKIVGGVPNGIVTSSGLIASIKFRAVSTGETTVSVRDTTRILLNDGVGSPVGYESNQGRYTIVPKAPEGVTIFSLTHPFQDRWYNNNSPILSWNMDAGVSGFSYILDTKPTTIPGNTANTEDIIYSAEDLEDGLWYFHIKALKSDVWGSTSHFLVRIDSTPPAQFSPTVNYLTAAVVNRLLVSFFSTDSLSGIDHFEVGVIDQKEDSTASPVFIQTESPYQLPFTMADKARVIIRAFDRAGNIRDSHIDVQAPGSIIKFLTDHAILLLILLLAFIFLLFLVHYLFGHHILRHIRRAFQIVKKEEEREGLKDGDGRHGDRGQANRSPLNQ